MSAVVPCTTRVTLVVLIVEAVIASLKVAVTFAPTATPVAPLAGAVPVTVGGVVSGGAPPAPEVGWALAQAAWAKTFPPAASASTRGRVVGPATGPPGALSAVLAPIVPES